MRTIVTGAAKAQAVADYLCGLQGSTDIDVPHRPLRDGSLRDIWNGEKVPLFDTDSLQLADGQVKTTILQ